MFEIPAVMSAYRGAALCLLFLLGLGQTPLSASAGKILVWPGEYSHWVNIQIAINELITRGHNVTVITHSATPTIKTAQSQAFSVDVVQVSLTKQALVDTADKALDYCIYGLPDANKIQAALEFKDLIGTVFDQNLAICRELFAQKDLLEKWRKEQFDVVLVDPVAFCGELIAHKLNLPFVLSLRFTLGTVMERHCGQLPSPPSYVPSFGLFFTDHMNFLQRVQNFLFIVFQDLMIYLITTVKWDHLYTEIMGKPTTVCDIFSKADIWLVRTYWDFEYPWPVLPNFKYVGGFHCRPAKPLPKDMEDFVQSSGDHGVVVFSLGTLIRNISTERANTIASALGQIPQKVLWRYTGKKPETLASNTRIYDWIPQNDLLGHPKTKAFITHGGTNGIYEAIYHGVPMVGLPLFGDQHDNLHHVQIKEAVITLEFTKMESKDLKQAINDVITNPSYKESIMRLSRIHHDQPMKPLDQYVYWIEYVMRNKGAKHLRVAAHDLTWYQYYCLDVAAFLLSVIALIVFIFVKTCSWLFRKCFRKTPAKSKKE